MTPEQMTDAQRRRQADIDSLLQTTAKIYKADAALTLIANGREVYVALHFTKASPPAEMVKLLRGIADEINGNLAHYETREGRAVVEL